MTVLRNKAGIDKRFAKSEDYRKTLETIIDTEKCPFCPDNFKYHKNPILKEHEGWLVTKNSWPYENTTHHFIFVPDEHREHITELTDQDMSALLYLMKWVSKEYGIRGGGLTMRFGEQKYTGATVVHIHAHLIVPELDPGKDVAKVVNFPIG